MNCNGAVLDEFETTPPEAAALCVGSPNTTGMVSGVETTTKVSVWLPLTDTNVLPESPGIFELTSTVVGLAPVPRTTFSVPLTFVVLPGREASSEDRGTVVADDRITFVTPFMTVVLPESGTAGLTGIVVAPEMTRSDVPDMTVGRAVIGVAPMAEAIADAMAAAEEEEAGERVLGESWVFEAGAFEVEGGDDASGVFGEADGDETSVLEISGLDRVLGEDEGKDGFSGVVEVCSPAGDSLEGEASRLALELGVGVSEVVTEPTGGVSDVAVNLGCGSAVSVDVGAACVGLAVVGLATETG